MNDQLNSVVRELPRQHLEELTMRLMAELRQARGETRRNADLTVLLTGVVFGTVVAAAGFMAGILLR